MGRNKKDLREELDATRAEADYLNRALNSARAELDVHRDREVARLDRLVLLREELRQVQIYRDRLAQTLSLCCYCGQPIEFGKRASSFTDGRSAHPECDLAWEDAHDPAARRRTTISTLHEIAGECAARGHRWDAARHREAAEAVRDHDTPDVDGVGEEDR